jgi:hypothetical protein
MSKSTITRLFVAASLALVVGIVLFIATGVAAIAGGVVTLGGPTVVRIDGAALGGVLPWLVLAALMSGAGSVAAVVSWIGALANTIRLDDKTWFAALLVLGLCSFGWVAMVAYVVAGPDDPVRAPAGGVSKMPAH